MPVSEESKQEWLIAEQIERIDKARYALDFIAYGILCVSDNIAVTGDMGDGMYHAVSLILDDIKEAEKSITSLTQSLIISNQV